MGQPPPPFHESTIMNHLSGFITFYGSSLCEGHHDRSMAQFSFLLATKKNTSKFFGKVFSAMPCNAGLFFYYISNKHGWRLF